MLHSHWLGKLANLNASKSAGRGIAPHKPLMMFTVIDMIESGDVPDGWVKYDVRLVSRFRDYWELVRERQRNKPDCGGGVSPPSPSKTRKSTSLNPRALTAHCFYLWHWLRKSAIALSHRLPASRKPVGAAFYAVIAWA